MHLIAFSSALCNYCAMTDMNKLRAALQGIDPDVYYDAVFSTLERQQISQDEANATNEGLERDFPALICAGDAAMDYGHEAGLDRTQINLIITGAVAAVAALKHMIDNEELEKLLAGPQPPDVEA